jgi:biopolymer transport protein ExbD
MPKLKREYSPASLDMTPMIDVVFQLMIFFIVTMKLTQDFNPDVKLELTRHGPMIEKSDPRTVVIEIDRRGWLSSHNAKMDKDTFRRIIHARFNRQGAFPVLIRADRRTKHQDVKAVMDICTEIGIWRLSFAGIKEPKTRESME